MNPDVLMENKNPYIPVKCRIVEWKRESPDNFTITLDLRLKHEPGQFVQVSIPGIGECPISICSYSEEHLKLNIREVGNMTSAMAKLRKGDSLFVRGPYGNGYKMGQFRNNNLIIIGGGCGVAPLKGVIEYVERHRDDYKDVHLFLGYRSPDNILFKEELAEWRKKYHLTVTIDENVHGEFCYNAKTGFITDALKNSSIDNGNKVVFICGPPIMMNYVIQVLKEKGFNDDQIFISAERLMYCAFGACCHCMIRGKFTCIDGPVFRYDEVKEYEND